jgi:molybdenum cofactor cytidylyltransferase
MPKKSKIAVLIMAAGGSTRIGSPKQLLKWKDSNLLVYTISKAIQLKVSKIIVVLGANSEEIISQLDQNKIRILVNHDWELGLGSSISEGVKFIQKSYPDISAVLIMLSDQPLIEQEHFIKMIRLFEHNTKKIIVTEYDDEKQGVPALFDNFYFKDLCALNADYGAKHLFKKYSKDIHEIVNKNASFDIDTLEQYEKLYLANH